VPDVTLIKQIAIFITSHFRLPARPQGNQRGRPAGQLRVLIERLGYGSRQITRWLWDGTSPGHTLPTRTVAWAALIEGHLANGSCDCAEEEQRRRPDRRSDYIAKKRHRCAQRHALARQPASGLRPDEFAYRAAVGVKDPLREIRGFIDSMLFPLIETPGERKLTWERVERRSKDDSPICPAADSIAPVEGSDVCGSCFSVDTKRKTIVVEWGAEGQLHNPGRRVAAAPQRTRAPVLICRQCRTFVGRRGNDVCRDEHHLWELTWLELGGRELEGDVNSRMQDIPISCCPNDDGDGRWPHFWHRDGPVRCPACGLRRRAGKKYSSVRVYVPLDDELFPV